MQNLLSLGLVLLIIFASGCTTNPFDPCERAFEKCNYDCGEGILSGLCKEQCTSEYRDCKEAEKIRSD